VRTMSPPASTDPTRAHGLHLLAPSVRGLSLSHVSTGVILSMTHGPACGLGSGPAGRRRRGWHRGRSVAPVAGSRPHLRPSRHQSARRDGGPRTTLLLAPHVTTPLMFRLSGLTARKHWCDL
jgi:hypothetical protein